MTKEIRRGKWSIDEWPESFPEELKNEVLDRINVEILGVVMGDAREI